MNSRNIACMAGALFIGACLTANATSAFARSPGAVVVNVKRIDPALQRTVSYADLNLAQKTIAGPSSAASSRPQAYCAWTSTRSATRPNA